MDGNTDMQNTDIQNTDTQNIEMQYIEMNNRQAFIWDLDGTLLDSYEEVVSSAYLTLKEYGIEKEESEILDYSIKYSVKDYFKLVEEETGRSCDEMYHRFHEIQDSRYELVKEEPGAIAILSELKARGTRNYVFTHRNKIAFQILERLGMLKYFQEIATLGDGFKRKPDPDGINYLVKKYRLDKNQTFYVGDRSIDMECAKNAGIRRILYCPGTNPEPKTGSEEYRIASLAEILDLYDLK